MDQPDVERVLRIETKYSNPVVKLYNAKTLGRPWRLNQDVQDPVKNYLDDINAAEEQIEKMEFDIVEDDDPHDEPDQALEISMEMKRVMMELVKNDPISPVEQKRKSVITKYKEKHEKSDPRLWK